MYQQQYYFELYCDKKYTLYVGDIHPLDRSKITMLLERFKAVRQYTEQLCEPLNTEDYVPQAAEFTSPPKWHLAHTTWFFEEMVLSAYAPQYAVFDDAFSFLFNSYYQGVGARAERKHRGLITRPTVANVYAYRQYVDSHIEQLLSIVLATLNEQQKTYINELVLLGIQHEQQHQELLLTDIKYTLSHNPTFPVYQKNTRFVDDTFHRSANHCPDNNRVKNPPSKQLHSGVQQSQWLNITEGIYLVGHDRVNGFCFDNELGQHKVYLHGYEISTGLVTNREFIQFIEAGGYKNFSYWLDEGWSWLCNNNIQTPLYWHNIKGQWFYYTLAGLQPVNLDASVCHVSYYEANAFACWKGARLPTEFEWEVASDQLDWGERWEWTGSAYLPYPGFKIGEGAVGEYNGKFMVNQMVLRGASRATSPQHSRKTYRNFFHPYFQWQYSGIRLVKESV